MMHPETARNLWAGLHECALMEKSITAQQAFFANWIAYVEFMLGCTSCFWKVQRFLKLWPVDYGEGFYLWSISLHDYVNKELGRNLFYPDLTLAPLKAKGLIQ